PLGLDFEAVADQRHRALQLAIRLWVLRIAAPVDANGGAHQPVLHVEAEKLASLGAAAEDESVPALGEADVLDHVLVLIRPERVEVVVGPRAAQHRAGGGLSLLEAIVPVLHAQTAEDRMLVIGHVAGVAPARPAPMITIRCGFIPLL